MIARHPANGTDHTPETTTGAGHTAAALASDAWLNALNHRYAVKQYDATRDIDDATWHALERTLVLSPSSGGLQPWKFVVVDDAETRKRLREAAYGQTQVTDAARFVVLAARTDFTVDDVDRFIARVAEVRGVTVESLKGLHAMLSSNLQKPDAERAAWTARQPYIALGAFLAAAATLGVDATPMEGFDPAAFDAELGLTAQGYRTVAAVAAGYRSPSDRYATLPKVRFAHDEVVTHV